MQIAGIRSVLNGRTTRPDAPSGRAAEPAQTLRDGAATARSAALAPLPPSPVRVAAPAQQVVIAFPTAEEAATASARTPRDAERAYRDTQALAAPRAAPALLEEAAEQAAPARPAARAARADAPGRDETAADGPRPTPTGIPGVVAQGLAALWRFLPGQAGSIGDQRRTGSAKATAARPGERNAAPASEGGWTEALTLFTLIATVCLALWLLVF